MSRKKNVISLSFFILVLSSLYLFLSGCGLLPKEDEKLRPPLVKPKAEEYQLYKVAKKDIVKSVKGTGTFVAVNEKPLSFKKSGLRLSSLNVRSGDQVKKGQVLATADVGNLSSQIELQELEVEKQRLNLQYLKKKYNDSKAMGESVSKSSLEEMQNNIACKEIDLKAANIVLSDLKKQLDDSTLKSPIDGVVTFVDRVRVGSVVEPYKTVVTVSDPQSLQILYKSSMLKDVKNGMTAKLTYQGKEYEGTVVMTPDDIPEDQTADYQDSILIQSDSLTGTGKIGEFVEIDITLLSKKDTIVIPNNALRKFLGQATVQLLDGNSKKEVSVEVGIETATEVEILSGLKEGDDVILR